MNIKKLEKATSIFKELQQLDKEIVEIEKLASFASNGKIKSSIELKIQNTEKKDEKIAFDADGSLIMPGTPSTFNIMEYYRRQYMEYCDFPIQNKKTDDRTIRQELSESLTLRILAVLICDKNTQREALINKLKKYGVTV